MGITFASMNSLPVPVQRFILVSRMEAVSFLVLLLVAMPLKYMAGIPGAVKVVGWAHGVLFIAYIVQLLRVAFMLKWDAMKVIYGSIASLLPFGPFVFERSLRQDN